MMNAYRMLPFFLILLLACHSKQPLDNKVIYLHIAHSRALENPSMDSFAEQLDYSIYDMLLLGGDMAWRSSREEETMQHLQQFFHLDEKSTLWALGNHDYSDLNRIKHYTKRPPYYSHHQNGINFIVLDTQDSSSSILGEQLEFFNQITDTITSSYLIILHHKLIWLDGHPEFKSKINQISNGPYGKCPYCLNPNNFYQDIYPKLVQLQKKGTQLICLGGDLGDELQEFQHQTEEGIYFLASGIQLDSEKSKGLVFEYDLIKKNLSWTFEKLENLPKKHKLD